MVLMTTLIPVVTKGLPAPLEGHCPCGLKPLRLTNQSFSLVQGTGTLFKVSINGSQAAVVDLGGVTISAAAVWQMETGTT